MQVGKRVVVEICNSKLFGKIMRVKKPNTLIQFADYAVEFPISMVVKISTKRTK